LLLAAFVISLTISLVRKWYWLDALLVFIIMFLLCRYVIEGRGCLKYVFFSADGLIRDKFTRYIFSFMVQLCLGLFLFFRKKSIRFIERKKAPVLPAGTANAG